MTERDLEQELQALLAPVPDQGFSNAVLARLAREHMNDAARPQRWRTPLMAFCGGVVSAGLASSLLPYLPSIPSLELTPFTPVLAGLVLLGVCLVTLEQTALD